MIAALASPLVPLVAPPEATIYVVGRLSDPSLFSLYAISDVGRGDRGPALFGINHLLDDSLLAAEGLEHSLGRHGIMVPEHCTVLAAVRRLGIRLYGRSDAWTNIVFL